MNEWMSMQVSALDALVALEFRDGRAQFSAFIVNRLTKNKTADQAMLCAIVHKMGSLRPKKFPDAKLNDHLLQSLQSATTHQLIAP